MHRRTLACSIPKDVKKAVYERDKGRCIFCGRPGLAEGHVVSRAHGGLGRKENIITICRRCHGLLDNSVYRDEMLQEAISYLKQYYPDWKREDMVYNKWEFLEN